MPIFASANGRVQRTFTDEELSRLRFALDGAMAIDTEAVPPAGDSAASIAVTDQRAVPGHKLIVGGNLSAAECKYLATRLHAFVQWVQEGPAPDASEEEILDAKARVSERLGAAYSTSQLSSLAPADWALLMERFRDALGHSSEDGGLVIA